MKPHIESYRTFKKIVLLDLARYRRVSGRFKLLKGFFRYPGFKFTFLLRACSYLRWHAWLKPLFFLLYPIFAFYQRFYGLSISYGTSIGGGLYIPHVGLCVVNPSAVIGENLYLAQGVTIGKSHSGARKGVPQLGSDVFVGPNACIFGKIVIGDNSVIGANSVVLKDVLPSTTVGGVPAREISKRGAAEILQES